MNMNTAKVETFVTAYRPLDNGARDVIDQDNDVELISAVPGEDLVALVLDRLERQGVQFRSYSSNPLVLRDGQNATVRAAATDPYSHPHTGVVEDVCVEVTGNHRLITAMLNRPDHWVNQ